jgi:hypothetical protein
VHQRHADLAKGDGFDLHAKFIEMFSERSASRGILGLTHQRGLCR